MRFAARVLALPAALAVVAAAAPEPLARIAAANGHAASVHIRGTMTRVVDGRTVVLTVEQLGTSRLVRRCVAEVCAGSWFDGHRLWEFGLNQIPLPEDGDAALPTRRTLAAIASYAFAEPAFRAAGGSAVAAGTATWRVRAPDGATLTAVLDPVRLSVRRVYDANGAPVATFRHDVRVGGASFALDRSGLDDVALDSATTAAGSLAAPDGAPATFVGSAEAKLSPDTVPIVGCTLGGRPVRCLLDTGATPSAVSLALTESLGLEPRGELEIAGFSRFVTGFVDAGPLALGAARFPHARFAVIPGVRAVAFDVVVGADLLGRVRLVLDRGRGVARIGPPGDATAGAQLLTFHDGVPLIGATLDGEPMTALLDTGDASTVSLGYAAYRRGPQWPVSGRAQAAGVAGGADALVVTIPDVRVGGIAFGATAATVSRTQDRPHVGVGVWSRCIVEVDEPNGRFACLPKG